MRALVTGGGGFAGYYLVEELLRQKHTVLSVGNSNAPADHQKLYKKIDLLEPQAVQSQINFKDFDVIFHLAGLTNPAESFQKPIEYFNINNDIQINLFEACLSQSAKPKFVIISSALVYDAKSPLPLTENTPVVPTSPYAASKLGQELLANYYGFRGFEVVTARSFNHIGPGQAPGFITSDFAKQIAAAEKDPQATIKVGNLEAERDYSDVRDIARAYVLLADKGKPGEIYNVCSGSSVSAKEILDQLLKLANRQINTEPNPELMRPSDNPKIYGDNSKLKQTTGWQPQISLAQTLKETLGYWRNQV